MKLLLFMFFFLPIFIIVYIICKHTGLSLMERMLIDISVGSLSGLLFHHLMAKWK